MLNLFYDGVSLYSAIFLPAGEGIPGNLAQIEGANPAIVSTRPWEKSTYDGQTVYGDNGSPFHCLGCAAFFQVINIQSAAVTPITAATTLTAAAPNAFAIGKAIILSASVLNINGTIQSGQSSNYSVSHRQPTPGTSSTACAATRWQVCRSPRPGAMRRTAVISNLTPY